ncbi:hypothetical protein AB0B45_00130 [Nonomuraea sp. NPDC049152]|uniref:hypothetical protein n=1 Tax=Nonomuraea sp. NPDC049152 TaxID=3154350 RepID=UPI003410B713
MAERTRVLKSGESMNPGDRILSRTTAQGWREFKLEYQTDGNLVLYDQGTLPSDKNGKPLWATDHWIPGGKLTMDRDRSLGVRNAAGAVWPEPAFRHPAGSSLVLHDDGNLVIYGPDGRPVWSPCTGTEIRQASYNRIRSFESIEQGFPIRSPNGRHSLEVTDKGVLTLFSDGAPRRRARMSSPQRGSVCLLQPEGTLVVYRAARDRRRHLISFRSGTAGVPGAELVLRDDGEAVLLDPSGKVIWDSESMFLPL